MYSEENEINFEPLVVIHLSPTIPASTKQWLLKRLTDKHDQDEGADLLARFEFNPESQVIVFRRVLTVDWID